MSTLYVRSTGARSYLGAGETRDPYVAIDGEVAQGDLPCVGRPVITKITGRVAMERAVVELARALARHRVGVDEARFVPHVRADDLARELEDIAMRLRLDGTGQFRVVKQRTSE